MGIPKKKHCGKPGAVSPTAAEMAKLRKWIFANLDELGMDEEARQEMAGSVRQDGICSMRGMRLADMRKMKSLMERMQIRQKNEAAKAKEAERKKKLKQHKRIHGDGKVASPEARYFLKSLAVSLWGGEWETKLPDFLGFTAIRWQERTGKTVAGLLEANGRHYLDWNDPRIPSQLHYQATEALKARIKREVGGKG